MWFVTGIAVVNNQLRTHCFGVFEDGVEAEQAILQKDCDMHCGIFTILVMEEIETGVKQKPHQEMWYKWNPHLREWYEAEPVTLDRRLLQVDCFALAV